jgi:hypothetical protein
MREVKFIQDQSRIGIALMPGLSSIGIFIEAIVFAQKYPKTSGPSVFGISIETLLISCLFAAFSFRAWHQSVVLKDDQLLVRSIFSTKRVRLDDIAEFGLYMNLIRSAWLAGVTKRNGSVVKFPFWARSWVRDDPKNQRMIDFMSKIEEAIQSLHVGTPAIACVVNY